MKNRKGISPLIATLLLIAIAVAASVLTYSWVMSMIGSQSAQAQTQVRIDSAAWAAGAFSLDCRNTGSIDAKIESVSIRLNEAGQAFDVFPASGTDAAVQKAIGPGAHVALGPITYAWEVSTSYVVRVTTNTGFFYEAVLTSPATVPT